MTDFASILNAWMAHTQDRVDLAEGTKRNYARVLQTLLHWSEDQAFGELSLTHFVRSRRRAGLSDRTIHLELSILRIAVRWAEHVATAQAAHRPSPVQGQPHHSLTGGGRLDHRLHAA